MTDFYVQNVMMQIYMLVTSNRSYNDSAVYFCINDKCRKAHVFLTVNKM
jgi:hypothetical protein